METLRIDLPETLKAYVDARVAEGGYGNIGDYVRALILAEQAERLGVEVPTSRPAPRQGGQWRGRVRVGDDFDDLPPDVADAFGMGSK